MEPLCGLCVRDRLRADPILVIARSEATKPSRGHSNAVCGPLAPHVPPPLDCFVARAPRNDGAANVATRPTNAWNRYADFAWAIGFGPIQFSSLRGAKRRSHPGAASLPSAAPWRRTCRRPWIASSQGLLAMTAPPTWLRDLQMHGTAMRTLRERSASGRSYSRHCEERSDEAIQGPHHCRPRPPGAARAATPGLLRRKGSSQ